MSVEERKGDDIKKKIKTDLIDSSKQRHELAEESRTQTGDVYEWTLTGKGENIKKEVQRKKKKKRKHCSLPFVVRYTQTHIHTL